MDHDKVYECLIKDEAIMDLAINCVVDTKENI